MQALPKSAVVENTTADTLKTAIRNYLAGIINDVERFNTADAISNWLNELLDDNAVEMDEVADVPAPALGVQAAGFNIGKAVSAVAGKFAGKVGQVIGSYTDRYTNNKPQKYGERPYPQVVVHFNDGVEARYFGNEAAQMLRA